MVFCTYACPPRKIFIFRGLYLRKELNIGIPDQVKALLFSVAISKKYGYSNSVHFPINAIFERSTFLKCFKKALSFELSRLEPLSRTFQ